MSSPPTSLFGHLRALAGQSALYGGADVASQAINLLLTPLFLIYLSTSDNGIIASLILLSALARFIFRMGLDAGFLRVYYDQNDDQGRRELTGTVALFSALVGAGLLSVLSLASPWIGQWLLRGAASAGFLVMLTLADVYVGTFLFVPLQLMRVEGKVRPLALLLALRNALNAALKVLFLVLGLGVGGVLLSDLLATAALALALAPVVLRRSRLSIRWPLLREAFAFGLPKAPHGIMIQLLNLADRWILVQFHGLSLAGIYDKAYAVGAGVKVALSAFEPAWQPFVYSRLGEPGARATLAGVASYAWLMFVAVGLVMAVFGSELLVLLTYTNRAFWPGAPVVPVVVLAYLLHGVFLLTSIGVGIEKRTRYYPLITLAAATTNLVANLVLVPSFGMMGAAWATVIGYVVMAGIGFVTSQRLFSLPFDWPWIARLTVAAVATFALSQAVPHAVIPALSMAKLAALRELSGALTYVVIAKASVLAVFPLLLWALQVVSPAERG